ncbi:MAG TPA: polysaccharide biosynthesis tyrosine autokinase [Paludibacteraceae bacterium]|nr:polysaccharide biosynthesis tyrosine autokinase [Paludibacteraceae bacterium]
MNKYPEKEDDYNPLTEKPVDFIGLLIKYISYWKWFILSLIICIAIAAIYLRYTLPKYEVKTSVLFKDDSKGSGSVEMNVFNDMSIITQKNNIDNILELLKNSVIIEKTVTELGLYTSYTSINTIPLIQKTGINRYFPNFGRYREKVLYGDECPVLISLPDSTLKYFTGQVVFEVLMHPYGLYEFSGTYAEKKFNIKASFSDKKVMLPFGVVNIKRGNIKLSKDMLIEVAIHQPSNVANYFLSQMKMVLASKTGSVVDLSFICSNENLGKDFIRKFIEVYNREEMNEKIEMANKTSQLIEEHLNALSSELSSVESQAEKYKQSQGITDLASQSDLFNNQTADVEQKRLEIETQLAIVSDLNNYIQNSANRDQLIPSNSGINSGNLNNLVSDYNRLILERNRLSRIASGSNQAMIDLTNQIETMYNTVQSSMQNERKNLQIARRDLLSKYNQTSARIRAIPRQERQYTEIKRQQGVREELFLYLLQKKEEKYMNMSSVVPSSKLIDNVHSLGPVSPRKNIILLSSLLIGLLIPVIGIKVRDLLRYQIENKEELEEISIVPVLGEIPRTDQSGKVLVKENNTDIFTEMVRLLRANLLFVMDNPDKKVINMLSSVSGEGKTFVTINLAISLALLDKKVLIIELDVRKPRLAEYIGIENKSGITLFLSGQINQNELIKPTDIHPNLSIITAGTIPPNPNELLAKPALDMLIDDLRHQFDYIVIDTAPIGVVSDSFLLNRLTDVTLYVVRAEFTPKKDIEDASLLYKKQKLKNMYFILNDVDLNKNTYRYGYGKKYGYGYVYGKNKHTYGYGTKTEKA